MLPERHYPSSHPVLEEVYTRIFKERGHTIIWIMQSAQHQSGELKIEDWNGTAVYVLPGRIKPSLTNFKAWLYQVKSKVQLIRDIVNDKKVDLFQVRNNVMDGLIGIYVKRKLNVPFVFQLSVPGPEMMIEHAKLVHTKAHLLQAILRGKLAGIIQKLILREADLIFPISEYMKFDVAKHGVPEDKMMSFPPGFDMSLTHRNVSGSDIRFRYKLGASPTLVYFGAIQELRRLDFLMRVMQMVVAQIPTAKLFMVGGPYIEVGTPGGHIRELKALAAGLGISENVIFTGYVPREEVYRYIAASDVGLSPIPPLPVYLVSSPVKLVETLGMGKAVVANDIPEQKHIISASHGGICTKYDEQEFANGIVYLLNNPEKAKQMGMLGQKYIEKYRSYDVLAKMVEDRYYQLLNRSTS